MSFTKAPDNSDFESKSVTLSFKSGNDWAWKRFEVHVRTNTHYLEGMVNGSMDVKDTLGGLPRSEVSVYGWLVPLLVGCGKAEISWQQDVMDENCSSCDG